MSKAKQYDDGGPAFPRPIGSYRTMDGVVYSQEQRGMSLRAYLTGQALAGILATNDYLSHYPEIAESAVSIADAVIAELRKPKEEGGAE